MGSRLSHILVSSVGLGARQCFVPAVFRVIENQVGTSLPNRMWKRESISPEKHGRNDENAYSRPPEQEN